MSNEAPKYYSQALLHPDTAVQIREHAIELANRRSLSGFLTIYTANNMELTSQLVGDPRKVKPVHADTARSKIQTVVNHGLSTSLRRARIYEKGQNRDDFSGLGSLFGGGVAILNPDIRQELIGAIAFSGGTEQEDEDLCRAALWKTGGLATDLSFQVSTARLTTNTQTEAVKCFICGATDYRSDAEFIIFNTHKDNISHIEQMFDRVSRSIQIYQPVGSNYIHCIKIGLCPPHSNAAEILRSETKHLHDQLWPELIEEMVLGQAL